MDHPPAAAATPVVAINPFVGLLEVAPESRQFRQWLPIRGSQIQPVGHLLHLLAEFFRLGERYSHVGELCARSDQLQGAGRMRLFGEPRRV